MAESTLVFAPYSYKDDLPAQEFVVEDVHVNFERPATPLSKITVLSHWFLTRQTLPEFIATRLQTLWPVTAARAWCHGIRSEYGARWQPHLVSL